MNKRQNMNWPLAANFEATNVTFLPKKLASNVQSTCIDNSKRPKSKLWHYCIKATICPSADCPCSRYRQWLAPATASSVDLNRSEDTGRSGERQGWRQKRQSSAGRKEATVAGKVSFPIWLWIVMLREVFSLDSWWECHVHSCLQVLIFLA